MLLPQDKIVFFFKMKAKVIKDKKENIFTCVEGNCNLEKLRHFRIFLS